MITQTLDTKAPGVVVSETSARLITQGQQTLILHSMEYVGKKTCYLFSDTLCHGIIKLGEPFKLHVSKFHDYYPQHRCTESQRRTWFSNKKVIFAYPVEVLEKQNTRATISHTLGELFTEKYEIGTSLKEKKTTRINDFSPIRDISCDQPILVYNTEEQQFIINTEPTNEFGKQLQMHLLAQYGPETIISFGDQFGNSYIPLLKFSGKRYKELQELKQVEVVPSITLPSPQKVTMEFRDPKRYVVEKQFKGISVRLQSMDGKTEIHSINGKAMTEMFPRLAEELKTLTRGNFIAEGILQFELKDKLVNTQLFKDYSHETAYYLGLLSTRGHISEKTISFSLRQEEENVLTELQEKIELVSTPKENVVECTLSESPSREIFIKGLGSENLINHLPERFNRSFLRGVIEGSAPVITENSISFSLSDNHTIKFLQRNISKILGKELLCTLQENTSKFHIQGKEAREFVKYLYTAGPSLEAYKTRAALLSDAPLCAHPDEDVAVLWVHDLLFYEPW